MPSPALRSQVGALPKRRGEWAHRFRRMSGTPREHLRVRIVPVKQQSSKQSVYFQHVTVKTRAADHCQSNNRQAKTKAFLSRRRPDRPQAGLAEGRRMSAPCSAWSRTVPLNAQGEEHFPRTVPVKQQSSKQSVYFQHVTVKTHTADHCQSNNRQAEARAFSLGVARTRPRAGLRKADGGLRPAPHGAGPLLWTPKATSTSQEQFQSSNSQANNRFISSMLW